MWNKFLESPSIIIGGEGQGYTEYEIIFPLNQFKQRLEEKAATKSCV